MGTNNINMKYRQFIKTTKKRLHAPEPAKLNIIKLLTLPPPIYYNSKWYASDDNN